MIDRLALRNEAAEHGVFLSDEMCDRFDLYARMLVDWNERCNLTAITAPEDIRIKHFVDSLLAAKWIQEGSELRVIDVGTGAGFPGVALKIACPGIRLTLLDSLGKRIRFLEALCGELGLECEFVQDRAETAAKRGELRERFDLAVSRGVAGLSALAEYCLPFVAVGGRFLAMKGPNGINEAKEAEDASAVLGGVLANAAEFRLPDKSTRIILEYEKREQTPERYPRGSAQIAKRPL